MRPYVLLRYTGIVLIFNAFFLFLSVAVCAMDGGRAIFPLVYSAFVVLLFGVFPLIFVPAARDVTNQEGLAIVVASWLLSCVVGMLPFLLWGGEFSLTNAWFESVSGYTTTGASILTDIEALPSGLLFWRSSTHWIGGLGIIVFVLAVLPYLGVGEITLYRAEVSPSAREKLNFRARRAMTILLFVYVGMTLAETILLLVFGMSLFDAVTHSFATIATGGFSTWNDSIAHFHSPAIECVIIVFMVLSGLHFALLFAAFSGKGEPLWRSSAARWYVGALILGVAIVTWNVYDAPFRSFGEALRGAAFQVISYGTSTGFATADVNLWPPLAGLALIFFLLQCACAGSTSGGIKADRVVLLAKAVVHRLRKTQFPSAVIPIRMDGSAVDSEVVHAGILYISIYLLVVFVSTVLLSAMGVDMLAAFTGTAACMGNVGPGLGSVGTAGNYAHLPGAGKWILTIVMLLGRLEIYGLILFFSPRLWR